MPCVVSLWRGSLLDFRGMKAFCGIDDKVYLPLVAIPVVEQVFDFHARVPIGLDDLGDTPCLEDVPGHRAGLQRLGRRPVRQIGA